MTLTDNLQLENRIIIYLSFPWKGMAGKPVD